MVSITWMKLGCALDGFPSMKVKWIIGVTVVGQGATGIVPLPIEESFHLCVSQ